MRKLMLTIAALLCLPALALARTAKLTPADTVASLDFPELVEDFDDQARTSGEIARRGSLCLG